MGAGAGGQLNIEGQHRGAVAAAAQVRKYGVVVVVVVVAGGGGGGAPKPPPPTLRTPGKMHPRRQ